MKKQATLVSSIVNLREKDWISFSCGPPGTITSVMRITLASCSIFNA